MHLVACQFCLQRNIFILNGSLHHIISHLKNRYYCWHSDNKPTSLAKHDPLHSCMITVIDRSLSIHFAGLKSKLRIKEDNQPDCVS